MSFCRDQHRHNYGGKKRCPFFHFFAHERKKTNDERPNDQKSGLTHDLMISFFILTFAHSPETQTEEEEDEEDEEDEERETTALFIHISFCLIFLNRSSSSLKGSSVTTP